MMDLTKNQEPVDLEIVSERDGSTKKFFVKSSILFVIGAVVAALIPTELHTSLTQNVFKTTVITYFGFSFIYAFILLYRCLTKKKLIRSAKEVVLTSLFFIWLFNLALLVDYCLLATNRDLEAVASNIIAYSIIAVFIIFQVYFLRKDQS